MKFEGIIGADIPLVAQKARDTITIHTYGLSKEAHHGSQRTLIPIRKLRVSLDEFSARFISGANLPSGVDLDDAVKRVLGCK
jgi:hypothetical protein